MSEREAIPAGLCQCGCGERTSLVLSSNRRLGLVRGQPFCFVRGHHRRVNRPKRTPERRHGQYLMTVVDGHPYAYTTEAGTSYVYSHRLVVEKAMGRALDPKHPIHHVNGDGLDNRNRNLVACEDPAYHELLHARAEALAATGNPEARRCWLCRKWDVPGDAFVVASKRRPGRHRACHAFFGRVKKVVGSELALAWLRIATEPVAEVAA